MLADQPAMIKKEPESELYSVGTFDMTRMFSCSVARIVTEWLVRFGIGIRDNNRPQFASGILLLVIALAQGAIFGIDSLDDLAQFDLRDGRTTEVPLRWNTHALNKPVFRNVTAKGPQEVPLNKERFCSFLRSLLTAAGYSKYATIHDIRRELGNKIEGVSHFRPAPLIES
jgi:hypothetical protein